MRWLVCAMLLIGTPLAAAAPEPTVEFRDGDHVVFVGNEFFERERDQGYIETWLTTRFPDRDITFRNLGYSGDTVRADARGLCDGWATFGPPDQGFNRLRDLIAHLHPTLIFVAYGMNESFQGPAGVESFRGGLERMLDMLERSHARIVLISPLRHENLGPPLPDPAPHNAELRLYIAAMQKVASKRGIPLINLYEAVPTDPGPPLTSDGIHPTPYGYWRLAAILERAMGYPPRTWKVSIDAASARSRAVGTRLSDIAISPGGLRFVALDQTLPPPRGPAPAPGEAGDLPAESRRLAVADLRPGRYTLRCQGRELATATAEQWAQGVELAPGPAARQTERLRRLIVAKNFDFFNYWRPDNDTYIFGYRSHEQGKNAVEVPRFEAMAAEKDAQIARLRKPVPCAYELLRADEPHRIGEPRRTGEPNRAGEPNGAGSTGLH